ncbi:MAG: hypothetical protein KH222_07775, partial [Butyricicoccus pullicaecorum]|nr:hypothetical protein [Butyricicoccus pullicaecorum]
WAGKLLQCASANALTHYKNKFSIFFAFTIDICAKRSAQLRRNSQSTYILFMHSVPLFYPFCVSCIMTGQTGQTSLSVPAVCNKAADVRFTRLTVKNRIFAQLCHTD